MAVNSTLKVGDQAPDFTLPATTGQPVHLYEVLETATVVLFFYLRVFTPVCTAEVCCFRAKFEEFEEHNAVVYGVSSDSPSSVERFARQNRLSFPLLSDVNGEVRARYRVPKAFGLLPGRSTYVIGQDKKIKNTVHAQLGAQTHVVESLRFLNGDVR